MIIGIHATTLQHQHVMQRHPRLLRKSIEIVVVANSVSDLANLSWQRSCLLVPVNEPVAY